MRSVALLFVGFFCVAVFATQPKVIETQPNTDDVVIADYNAVQDFHADNNGQTDATAAIQSALTTCYNDGGGTVWLPAGKYLVSNTISIPAFCSLRGDNNSVVYATVAAGENGPSVFSIGGSAGLIGITIYYPNQSLPNVTPYGYTIVIPADTSENYMLASVMNVTLVNSYKGIAVSPNMTSSHEVTTIKNVRGTALSVGLFSTNSSDVDVYENINFSSAAWLNSGFPAPAAADLISYMQSGATGFMLGDLEWSQFINIALSDFNIGVHIVQGTRTKFIGSFISTNVQNCDVALMAESIDSRFDLGAEFVNSSLQGISSAVTNNCNTPITLNYSSVSGPTYGKVSLVQDPQTVPPSAVPLSQVAIPKTSSVHMFNTALSPYSTPRVLPNKSGQLPSADATPAIQSALNDAGTAGGGVVYLPPGYYYLSSHLSVPANVELRGSSSLPNRDEATSSRGTVLFVNEGQDSPTAASDVATVTLNGDHAGISGLRFFYVHNVPTATGMHQFPYAIRGNGANTYVRNIGIGNGAYGVDFSTYANPNHYIERVVGVVMRNLISVGNGSGQVRNILSNPNSAYRNGYQVAGWPAESSSDFTPFVNSMRASLAFIKITGGAQTDEEDIGNVFAYGAMIGISNDKSLSKVFNVGTDNLGQYTIVATQQIFVENILRYNGKGSTYGTGAGNIIRYNDDILKNSFLGL